jgi:hypothetical protein
VVMMTPGQIKRRRSSQGGVVLTVSVLVSMLERRRRWRWARRTTKSHIQPAQTSPRMPPMVKAPPYVRPMVRVFQWKNLVKIAATVTAGTIDAKPYMVA